MIKLKLSKDNLSLTEKTFDQKNITLGRNIDCDVVINDPSISPVHASFSVKKGRLRVKDEGSVNGVWYKKRRVIRKKFNSFTTLSVSNKYDLTLEFEDSEWLSQKHNKKEHLEYLIKTFDPKKYFKQIIAVVLLLCVVFLVFKVVQAFKVSRLKGDKNNIISENTIDTKAKDRLKKAKDFYFNGEYVLAASEFSKVLNRYPEQEEALNYSQQIKSDYAPQIDDKFSDLVEHARYDEAVRFIDSVKSVLGSQGSKFYSEILNGQKRLVEGENLFRSGEYKRAVNKVKNIKVLDNARLERLNLYLKSTLEFKQKLLIVNSMVIAQEYDNALNYMDDTYQLYKNFLAERLKEKYRNQYNLIQVLSRMQNAYLKDYNTIFLSLFKKASTEFGMSNPSIVRFAEKALKIEGHIAENIEVLKADAAENIQRLYGELKNDKESVSAWKDFYIYLSKLELYQVVKSTKRETAQTQEYRSFFDRYVRDLYDEAYILDSFGKTDEAKIVYEKILSIIDESSKYYLKVEKKYNKYL